MRSAVGWALVLAACTTRIGDGERVEFFGTVSAEIERAARALEPAARGRLAVVLPEAHRADGWEGALRVLSEHPLLEPLAREIRGVIEREADPDMRLQIGVQPGNRRLRDLVVASLERGLEPPAEEEAAPLPGREEAIP